jgi:hypothetical protein
MRYTVEQMKAIMDEAVNSYFNDGVGPTEQLRKMGVDIDNLVSDPAFEILSKDRQVGLLGGIYVGMKLCQSQHEGALEELGAFDEFNDPPMV